MTKRNYQYKGYCELGLRLIPIVAIIIEIEAPIAQVRT